MTVLLVLAILHGLLAAYATVTIVRSHAAPPERRRQARFAWLVPLVGPAVTIGVHQSDRDRSLTGPSDRPIGSSIEESPYSGLDEHPP